MDSIFREEQENLTKVENQIKNIILRYENATKRANGSLSGIKRYDYGDLVDWQYIKNDADFSEAQVKRYRKCLPKPYFGRMDLRTGSEKDEDIITFFVGDEGIADSDEVIVVDWRAPIGDLYYKAEHEYEVEGECYSLELKRALTIKNAKLIGYHTEFDRSDESLEGEIVDPFLVEVLKDNRRQHKLTDIIRTIQHNQNQIIRRPLNENFVVQGCAGSGKTMIMLHRLSYLKYNYKDLRARDIVVITPNRFFNAHINDLSQKLELNEIPHFSVEEYYVRLIKSYNKDVEARPAVTSEKTLNEALLRELYSLEYISDVSKQYHEYWNQVLSEINTARLQDLAKQHSIPFPNIESHKLGTYNSLDHVLNELTRRYQGAKESCKAIKARLQSKNEELERLETEKQTALNVFSILKEQTLCNLHAQALQCAEDRQNANARITSLKDEIALLHEEGQRLEDDTQQIGESKRLLKENLERYTNYESLSNTNDSLAAQLKQDFAETIAAIKNKEADLKKIASYNFVKRNRVVNEISELKKSFTLSISEFLSSATKAFENQLYYIEERQRYISNEIAQKNRQIVSLKDSLVETHTKEKAFYSCIGLIVRDSVAIIPESLSVTHYLYCKSLTEGYELQALNLNKITKRIDEAQRDLVSLKEDLEHKNTLLPSESEVSYIDECRIALKKLEFGSITKKVYFKSLLNKYKHYGQKYSKNNYRHKLYLKLMYANLYYSRPHSINERFVNIDEAQDLSAAEYKLLRMVLGERCSFNLFGDINQAVYSYKGIEDWEDITDITAGNIFVLNENYRNTVQITEYCNSQFGADVYPIGITGHSVQEKSLQNAVEWILNMKSQNPRCRTAIIHRHGIKDIQTKLRTLLAGQSISWDAVDDGKLSVISVESAKGLEFDAVVVVLDHMSINEQYISFTRALDHLTVVREKFNPELADEALDGVESEFADKDDSVDNM